MQRSGAFLGGATRRARVAALSLDGSYIACRSGATNLVPNVTDGTADIFSRSPGC
jgi:hypothetical protein